MRPSGSKGLEIGQQLVNVGVEAKPHMPQLGAQGPFFSSKPTGTVERAFKLRYAHRCRRWQKAREVKPQDKHRVFGFRVNITQRFEKS